MHIISILVVMLFLSGCGESNTAPDFTCTLDGIYLLPFGNRDSVGQLWAHCSKFIRKPSGILILSSKLPTVTIYNLYDVYNVNTYLPDGEYQEFTLDLTYYDDLVRSFRKGDTIYFRAYPINENTHYEYNTAGEVVKYSELGTSSNALSVIWK